jgi:hypothetical protein
VGHGLSVVPQNRQEDEDGAGHVWRSNDLLHVKASQGRVFEFVSRLSEVRQWVVRVAPKQRSHEDEVEDGLVDAIGCVRPFYPNFVIFLLLGSRGSLVF